MNILVIDSTAEQLVVAATFDGKMAQRISFEGSKKHNSLLLVFVDEICEELGIDIVDFDCFGCVVGAGSFTGIRIGVSSVKALAFASGKPCVSLTCFDEVAFDKNDDKFVVALDAKHDNFYCGIFEKNWTKCVELKSISKQELLQLGLPVYEKITFCNPKTLIDIVTYRAEKGEFAELEPLYLKKSQAERERDGE
ncbi:MAG: tRNA (adenosine(37)-N6)-threonylcarbamoyltransferase complex dimerization subunit type 1 TsaB [Clostridia bacterium]